MGIKEKLYQRHAKKYEGKFREYMEAEMRAGEEELKIIKGKLLDTVNPETGKRFGKDAVETIMEVITIPEDVEDMVEGFKKGIGLK